MVINIHIYLHMYRKTENKMTFFLGLFGFCVWVFCLHYVCRPGMCLVSLEVRTGQEPLWTTLWVPRTEPQSSVLGVSGSASEPCVYPALAFFLSFFFSFQFVVWFWFLWISLCRPGLELRDPCLCLLNAYATTTWIHFFFKWQILVNLLGQGMASVSNLLSVQLPVASLFTSVAFRTCWTWGLTGFLGLLACEVPWFLVVLLSSLF